MHRLDWPKGVRGFFALALVLAVFFSYDMGVRPFADPDEGRYVEIPREMVVSGDYITPRLNGLKYFEKPALFYWMQAASIKAFGINETSMRLWIVIFAILGCLCVFLVGSRFYYNGVGLLSSGILATSALYYAHSHLIILDLVLSVFMSGALWCFFAAFVRKDKAPHKIITSLAESTISEDFLGDTERRTAVYSDVHEDSSTGSTTKIPDRGRLCERYIVAMYVLSALACLTKGLIGIVLPAFVAFLWVIFTKNWKKIPEMLYVPGIVAFLVIFLPWHILVISKNSDFFHFYFVVEHFLRYTTTIHERYQPMWFFLPVLLVGFLPWTGFSLVALKNTFRKKQMFSENVFFLCWIFGIFGFFSFSSSKLIPYILPIMQPLALLTGINIVESIKSESRDFRNGALTNIFLFGIAMVAYFIAKPQISDVLQDPDAQTFIYVFGGIFITAAIVLLAAAYPKWLKFHRFNALLLFLFLGANMMWVINKASTYYQEVKKPPTKNMAEFVRMNKTKDDLVFCYDRYYQDFPVYLNSTVNIVNFVGELEFGANAEKEKHVIWQDKEFWDFWKTTDKRIFLLVSKEKYREVFASKVGMHHILDFDKSFTVISNK
ncbi:glycosyl transferase [Alphaproteobacteria bacterium]|nr:glycosyl transferase [Alphaproteobacteria bacterium]